RIQRKAYAVERNRPDLERPWSFPTRVRSAHPCGELPWPPDNRDELLYHWRAHFRGSSGAAPASQDEVEFTPPDRPEHPRDLTARGQARRSAEGCESRGSP